MDLLDEAQQLFPYTRLNRRTLHRHPELAFKEFNTAKLVASELSKLGLEVSGGFGVTGVVAEIEGAFDGPTIALRFDMDALPIQEQNPVDYISEIPGCMHACGHDAHVAIGLSVAHLLEKHKAELHGKVRLFFQPGEEGAGGAEAFIADGGMGLPLPEAIFGLHVWNEKPVGWLGVAEGPIMAGSSSFTIQISGKGGHGAIPHLSADPIVAMANLITAAQSIVSRNTDPTDAGVLSFCAVHGGEAFNVIPQSVTLKGTIRSFDQNVGTLIRDRLTDISHHVCSGLGCSASIEFIENTLPVINDHRTTNIVANVCTQLFPQMQLDRQGMTTMGAEDFASFLARIPGTFFFVGSNNPQKGIIHGHHHPQFDIDEESLVPAVAIMAGVALRYGVDTPIA